MIKMRVAQLINSRFNAVKNQFVISDGSKTTFQSYSSKICTYDEENNTLVLYPEWDYSNTTRTHFKTFINDFTSFEYKNRQKWLKEIENNNSIKLI